MKMLILKNILHVLIVYIETNKLLLNSWEKNEKRKMDKIEMCASKNFFLFFERKIAQLLFLKKFILLEFHETFSKTI